MTKRLGIGMVGSGFNAKFHLLGFVGVRDADVLGVWSPNQSNAAETAGIAKKLGVGEAKAYPSIAAMVEDPAIDAIWLCGPNFTRIENVEAIVSTIERGLGTLLGIACEKPLARNVTEAKRVLELVNKVGLPHGYLENQVFAPQIEVGRTLLWARGAKLTGRPYLARAAEEHSGPHGPWFWQGALQGGGVLNDMMCHSSLLVQHLLTDPTKPTTSVRPARITAHIASLKWTRPAYAKKLTATMGKDVNYDKAPSEDFASVVIEFTTDDGHRVLGEATTSWSFVGAGLRLSAELLGPEYSMSWNTLDSPLKLFFSREVKGKAADDGLHERRAGEDARVPPQRTGGIRACCRERNVETMRQLRIVDCGLRIGRAAVESAIRNPQSAIGSLALLALICSPVRSPAQQWPVHSLDRPRPPVIDPGPERPPVPPPSDAIVLFDGKDLGAWQSQDSTPAKWVVRNGYVEVAPHTGVIMTKRGFGDFQLHVEWAAPTPPKGESQERGNSGVFLMGHYEIQVLDTYHNDTYADGQAAAVYGQTPPLVNACRPPGQWQAYDIVFHLPHFAADGSVRDSARV